MQQNKIVRRKLADLKPDPTNPNQMSKEKHAGLRQSYQKFGPLKFIIIDQNDLILDGHQRVPELQALGETETDCIQVDVKDEADRILARQVCNKLYGDHEPVKDSNDFLKLYNVNRLELLSQMLGENQDKYKVALEKHHGIDFGFNKTSIGRLADIYMVPPFSVLDTRQGYWQDRRRRWLQLGIESELGREGTLLALPTSLNRPKYQHLMKTATSVFDPVLCEVVYGWFCRAHGKVLDPFAGGSVRGIVAALQGLNYTGVELRPEQLHANQAQWEIIGKGHQGPTWLEGDSLKLDELTAGKQFDLLFTCPPYGDLEKYSSDPADLSNMPWEDFLTAYHKIIELACAKLAQDRFAVLVVSNIRGPDGAYRDLVGATIRAGQDAGLRLYNDIVLINAIGTAPIRAQNIFATKRKVVKVHQNVLVFFKGEFGNIAKGLELSAD